MVPPSLPAATARRAIVHVVALLWRYTDGVSKSIQVKDVPDDVHAKLRLRAGKKGYSLQEYLLRKLVEEARQPDLDEVLERASHRSGGSLPLATAAELLRAERDAR